MKFKIIFKKNSSFAGHYYRGKIILNLSHHFTIHEICDTIIHESLHHCIGQVISDLDNETEHFAIHRLMGDWY